MLKYDKIGISEGIDVNKTSKSKECKFCCYWYFLLKKVHTEFIFNIWVNIKQKKKMNKFDLIGKMGNIYCNDWNNNNNNSNNNNHNNHNDNKIDNDNGNSNKNLIKTIFLTVYKNELLLAQ